MRDLSKRIEAGKKKLEANARKSLRVYEVEELIEASSLRGSDELIKLISNVYALGFEEGYRASQSKANNNRRVTV